MDALLVLNKINEKLIEDSRSEKCPGLLHGKMGIAIYFFHYAKLTEKEEFETVAFQLIEDIQQQIHENSPLSYARGLAGIGCGLEYLSQHHFIQTETDDILEEVDGIIFRSVIYTEFTDTSLHTGICGLGRYLLFRLSNPRTDPDKIKTLSNKMLLIHVIEKLERLLSESKRLTPDIQLLLAQIDKLHIYPSKVKTLLLKYKTEEPDINEERRGTMIPCSYSGHSFSTENSSLGIHNGYAATGLRIMEQINSQHKTWRELI